jgi:hypothetical protein
MYEAVHEFKVESLMELSRFGLVRVGRSCDLVRGGEGD